MYHLSLKNDITSAEHDFEVVFVFASDVHACPSDLKTNGIMEFVYFIKSSSRTLFPALQKLRRKYVKSEDMQIVLPECFRLVL